jgi:serine/threonine protein kinase
VLIDDAEHAVLCDFGLSRIKSDAISRSANSTTISIPGSRNWMSPERIMGGKSALILLRRAERRLPLIGELRKPVDIYAFGMTMFEVCCFLFYTTLS